MKERQVRKREAERDITEAPPQSLAFSYRGKSDSDVTVFQSELYWIMIYLNQAKYENRYRSYSVNEKLTWGW